MNHSSNSFKKSKWVKINRSQERFALGHKKGTNCQKHTKNTNFSNESLVFLRGICPNHERITHIALLWRATWAHHSHRSFVKSNASETLTVALYSIIGDFEQKSEVGMSERANSQPWVDCDYFLLKVSSWLKSGIS